MTRVSVPPAERRRRWLVARHRENPRCEYCNSLTVVGDDGWLRPTIDHYRSLKRGGKDRENNYVLSCRACNQAKGAGQSVDWDKRRSLINHTHLSGAPA